LTLTELLQRHLRFAPVFGGVIPKVCKSITMFFAILRVCE
jgi:hypothetical protein